MSNIDENGHAAPSDKPAHSHYDSRPIANSVLAIFFAFLALALVLGYLFLNKMADISRQDDCMLAHRTNC